MKKNNYRIKRNIPPLSSEDIARHKDFDALLEQFEQTPVASGTKRPTVLRLLAVGGAVAAAIAALIIVFTVDFGTTRSIEAYAAAEETYFEEQPFINPPIEEVKAQFASYSVNANQGGVYEYQGGSRIVVPAAAFMNDRGELIEGDVSLYYREMHDQIDFFLSGIPMVYDSAGVKYNLESAGMVEIYAEQDGKRVRMAPGKDIDVELVSTINVPNLNVPPKYNIYKLDTVARNWVYQDVDKIQIIEDAEVPLDKNSPVYAAQKIYQERLQNIQQSEREALAQIEATIPAPEEPVKPQKPRSDLPTFELEFDAAADVSEYEGVLWQLSPNNPPLNENASKIEWEDVTVEKVNAEEYEITYTKGDAELKILAVLVLDGPDYEKALEAYNEKYAAYEQQLAEREAQLKEQKEALRERIARERAAAETAYQEDLSDLQAKGLDYAATDLTIKRKVVNRFKATSFGIWNCDRPLPPMVYQIQADFVDQNGNSYTAQTGYLVDKSRNTVYRFLATEATPLQFNANSENLLWLMTEDNRIAILRPEDFKRINQQRGTQEIILDLIEQPVRNEEEVRKVLKI